MNVWICLMYQVNTLTVTMQIVIGESIKAAATLIKTHKLKHQTSNTVGLAQLYVAICNCSFYFDWNSEQSKMYCFSNGWHCAVIGNCENKFYDRTCVLIPVFKWVYIFGVVYIFCFRMLENIVPYVLTNFTTFLFCLYATCLQTVVASSDWSLVSCSD